MRASIELGSELGEDGLTMRAIASRLGVSATALYQHFESKAAILREIRMLGTLDLQRVLAPAFALEDPLARLVELSRAYVQFALDHPWLYKVLLQEEEVDWATLSEEERERLMAPRVAVQSIVEEGQRQGRFRHELDPYHATMLLWAALHGLASLIISGRISSTHPTYPIADRDAFVTDFVTTAVRSLEPAHPASASGRDARSIDP